MTDWTRQRHWEDLEEGLELDPVAFPLSLYRLVMAAGATRDFNSIHHNSEVARATGAPEAYANTMFLQGMWERTVREFIGLEGRLLAFSNFRMRTFSAAGETIVVKGFVRRTWIEGGEGRADIEIWSEAGARTVVGPGTATVALPRRRERGG